MFLFGFFIGAVILLRGTVTDTTQEPPYYHEDYTRRKLRKEIPSSQVEWTDPC